MLEEDDGDDEVEAVTETVTAKGGKMGRPRVELNKTVLRALAVLQCTHEEIAAGLAAADPDKKLIIRTLKRRLKEPEYAAIIKAGQAEGRISLRRLQWRHAQMPNSAGVNMTIHLSKHNLGQTDKSALELSGKVDSQIEVASARDRVARRIDDLAKRIQSRVTGLAAGAGANAGAKAPSKV